MYTLLQHFPGTKLIWILHDRRLFIYCRSLFLFNEEEREGGMKKGKEGGMEKERWYQGRKGSGVLEGRGLNPYLLTRGMNSWVEEGLHCWKGIISNTSAVNIVLPTRHVSGMQHYLCIQTKHGLLLIHFELKSWRIWSAGMLLCIVTPVPPLLFGMSSCFKWMLPHVHTLHISSTIPIQEVQWSKWGEFIKIHSTADSHSLGLSYLTLGMTVPLNVSTLL